jgi:hypothetical protein
VPADLTGFEPERIRTCTDPNGPRPRTPPPSLPPPHASPASPIPPLPHSPTLFPSLSPHPPTPSQRRPCSLPPLRHPCHSPLAPPLSPLHMLPPSSRRSHTRLLSLLPATALTPLARSSSRPSSHPSTCSKTKVIRRWHAVCKCKVRDFANCLTEGRTFDPTVRNGPPPPPNFNDVFRLASLSSDRPFSLSLSSFIFVPPRRFPSPQHQTRDRKRRHRHHHRQRGTPSSHAPTIPTINIIMTLLLLIIIIIALINML